MWYEEEIPEFVAFGCYAPEGFYKKSGSHIVLCPECYAKCILISYPLDD
ncbi:hypothetical protein [Clostridium sp.]